jgi:alpha-1,3-glucosyltransferase
MVCAASFKVTALCFALPFVTLVIAKLMVTHKQKTAGVVFEIAKLAFFFGITIKAIWFKWAATEYQMSVIRRIFPLHRGVFEDPVANLWCTLNAWSFWQPERTQDFNTNLGYFLFTMGTTLVACLPSCYLLYKAPTRKQFLYCLFCTSMCFFLFGFQVHEKQILAANLAFALLLTDLTDYLALFTFVSSFSMWRLYQKDNN